MKKNKLLIVGAFPDSNTQIFGGIATTCLSLLNSSFSTYYDLELIDSTQISNPPPSFSVRLMLASRRLVRFISVLFYSKPDAVLIFTSSGTSLMEKGAMAWLARMRRIPVFLFPRGGRLMQSVNESKIQRAWVVPVMRGATHIFCQGPAWQRFAMDLLDYPEDRAPIIHNWTATESLLMIGDKRPLVLKADSLSLLFLGWLEEEKGIFELLDACLSLSKTYKFRLIIAGRGHAEEKARAFVHSHGLDDVVEFAGWVAGEAKETLLAQADILVLPSWAEGFPNAIIEAMAAKLAVIVTTVGNVPDLITDRQQALLAPPQDKDALQSAIESLFLDQHFRLELADRGHKFSREKFSIEQGVNKLTSVIDAAILERKYLK